MKTQHRNVEFNASDRCDRCGAQAYALFSRDGLELQFCLHHAKQHKLALEMSGWEPAYDFAGIEQLVEPDAVLT